MNRFWARIILWWYDICPIHGEIKKSWYAANFTSTSSAKYKGKKCEECYSKWRDGKKSSTQIREERIRKAKEAIVPGEAWTLLK